MFATTTASHGATTHGVTIPVGRLRLEGDLSIPQDATGIVVFAHGSGSSRHSPRNQFVARQIRDAGVGTLLFDLLTAREEDVDARTGHLRFDIGLLANRLEGVASWVRTNDETSHLRIGFFGASTGAAAAIVAAARLGSAIGAVVSRGGRPDLAGGALRTVASPTLFIVGGNDVPVIALNRHAFDQMMCHREMVVVPRATHLFSEPGALEEVARLAADWFARYLQPTNGR